MSQDDKPADNKPEQLEKQVRATIAPLPDSDRRDKRRARIAQPVRVRPSMPGGDEFDDVLATINVSRHGLYFSTDRPTYKKGLRLFITLPFHDDPNAINLEYIGEVVRVDRLADGNFGVAVHLKMTVNLQASGSGQIKY
jgi:hypothetical protein